MRIKASQALFLGDGVYVQLRDETGDGIILTTGSHKLDAADNTIHLEPEVLQSLIDFLVAHDFVVTS